MADIPVDEQKKPEIMQKCGNPGRNPNLGNVRFPLEFEFSLQFTAAFQPGN
jgi:hypothetical protein